MNRPTPARAMLRHAALYALLLSGLCAHALADDADSKSFVPAPAFSALQQWVTVQTVPSPGTGPVVSVVAVPLTHTAASAEAGTYQPAPVIKGLPDLPLLRAAGQQAGNAWPGTLNYQGLSVRLWVLNAKGTRIELRSPAVALKSGERFKVQLTPTFPAVASIDQVVGDVWYGKRTGQVYPAAGKSVAMQAGESITLPLADKEFFVMNPAMQERFVLSVRHAKAKGEARSDQPIYRQDADHGSQYLQLVPTGTYPAIEQLLSLAK